MTTVLITGASSGLGLAAARAVAGRAHVLLTGRDPERTARAAEAIGGTPVLVDLASLEDVRRVAADLPEVHVLACNAGLQLPGPLTLTADGFEETFQVNHLAHVALLDALLARGDRLRRVAFVGSATHDPAQRTGMPAPPDVSVERLSRGGTDDEDDRHAGRRRYTASKLLATAIVPALARAHPELYAAGLDPGLMTGTGLARSYPAALARVYGALAPALALLPFASTPERSAAVLASLLFDDPPPAPSGAVLDHRGRPARRSARAADERFQDEVLRASRELLRGAAVPAAANGSTGR
jgi:protochlorophyllide reductase